MPENNSQMLEAYQPKNYLPELFLFPDGTGIHGDPRYIKINIRPLELERIVAASNSKIFDTNFLQTQLRQLPMDIEITQNRQNVFKDIFSVDGLYDLLTKAMFGLEEIEKVKFSNMQPEYSMLEMAKFLSVLSEP